VQAQSEEKVQNCLSLLEQRHSSLIAKDWRQLELLSRRYVSKCYGVYTSEDDLYVDSTSLAMSEIVQSKMWLKDYQAALDEAKKCIDFDYNNLGCHINKTYALIKLDNIPEATKEYDVSTRLYKHLFEKYEELLKKNTLDTKKQVILNQVQIINTLASSFDDMHSRILSK
jgi:tetratricopeptide (TPR) repeat protein